MLGERVGFVGSSAHDEAADIIVERASGLGGIGFTMSILIAGLAFTEIPAELLAAKTAILAGSVSAALVGLAYMSIACREKR